MGSHVTDNIEYVTIASTGNATDFGNLTTTKKNCTGSGGNGSRGLACGASFAATIDYITIASTGNASDFGDLTVSKRALSGASFQHQEG